MPKTIKVKLTFTWELYGTMPGDRDVFSTYVAGLAPSEEGAEGELADFDAIALEKRATTIFASDENGAPALRDYQAKGFFKDACSMLSRVKGQTKSSGLKAYKKIIDGLIFIAPRYIPIAVVGEVGTSQRPLRAMTARGEMTALASSETVPAGSSIEVAITLLDEKLEPLVEEWLDYGGMRGLGQWRNAGNGTFKWERIGDT